MKTKNVALVTLLILCFALIVSGCGGGGGRNGSKPKPPIEDPAPPPIVDPNPPDNGSDPVPPIKDTRPWGKCPDDGLKDDDPDKKKWINREKECYYDDGSEAGVAAFKYYWCTYYAAREFQKIAPSPGVNWAKTGESDANKWIGRASSSGWVTSDDPEEPRLVAGSILVWSGNHVHFIRQVSDNGITVEGMNEARIEEHEPIDPSHGRHNYLGYEFYTGYVYRYFYTFEEIKSGSEFGQFLGYILPIRQGDVTQPHNTEASYLPSSYSVDGARVITGEPFSTMNHELPSLLIKDESTIFFIKEYSNEFIEDHNGVYAKVWVQYYNSKPFGESEFYELKEFSNTGLFTEMPMPIFDRYHIYHTHPDGTLGNLGHLKINDPMFIRISFFEGEELRAYQVVEVKK